MRTIDLVMARPRTCSYTVPARHTDDIGSVARLPGDERLVCVLTRMTPRYP